MPLSNPAPSAVGSIKSDTATSTNVLSATSSTQLLAANPERNGAMIWNDSQARLFIKFGDAVAQNNFSLILEAGGYFETPFAYTGEISGIWTTANGVARIVELS